MTLKLSNFGLMAMLHNSVVSLPSSYSQNLIIQSTLNGTILKQTMERGFIKLGMLNKRSRLPQTLEAAVAAWGHLTFLSELLNLTICTSRYILCSLLTIFCNKFHNWISLFYNESIVKVSFVSYKKYSKKSFRQVKEVVTLGWITTVLYFII